MTSFLPGSCMIIGKFDAPVVQKRLAPDDTVVMYSNFVLVCKVVGLSEYRSPYHMPKAMKG